jgi:anthranilate synthase component I
MTGAIVSRTLLADLTTPVAVMRRFLAGGEEAFLLESVAGGENVARFTFLGVAPRGRICFVGREITVESDGQVRRMTGDPLEVLYEQTVRSGYAPNAGDPPFTGGAVGYLCYDAVRLFERIPDRHPRGTKFPDGLFFLCDTVVAFDHARQVMVLVTHLRPEDGGDEATRRSRAEERLDRLSALAGGETPAPASPAPAGGEPFRPLVSPSVFLDAVSRAQEHIAAGDIYQVQISRRWEARLGVDPFDVYRALRTINPSPYMFFLRTRDGDVLGASPELLVRCREGHVETRPIAGTYPRGATPAEDAALADRMLADPKERAEHVMLVDLGRNDLGRVCRIGSVRVPEFFIVERYSHVQHIVSDVQGELGPGQTSLDALAACFPAGTLTGAPKIRAMELIDELETSRRGLYGGAIGYLDFSGNLDSCIVIRTMVVEEGVGRIQAAAGIVADSVPERELEETEIKARALFRAVEMAREMADSPRKGANRASTFPRQEAEPGAEAGGGAAPSGRISRAGARDDE